MDDRILEQTYQENLEERLIAYIADQRGVSLEKAMDIYYSSDLAEKIHNGIEGAGADSSGDRTGAVPIIPCVMGTVLLTTPLCQQNRPCDNGATHSPPL